MRHRHITMIMLLIAAVTINIALGQRKVSHVTPSNDLRPVTKEELKEIKRQEKLKLLRTDSLTLDSLRRDSIERASKKVYRPTLMGITLGANIWGTLMRALGQDHGDADIWAAVNFKNRYIPVVEVGFGQAKTSPDDGNFTYKGKMSLYAKVGMNYNFMASKDPKYQLFAGVRFGASKFKYDITGVSVANGYWSGDASTFDLRDQSSSAIWAEAVAGIQVELFKNFSMGWTVRYNFPFNIKDTENSRPYYIPGYGTRDGHLNISVSIAYTLPLNRDKIVDRNVPAITPLAPEDTITIHDRPLPADTIPARQ